MRSAAFRANRYSSTTETQRLRDAQRLTLGSVGLSKHVSRPARPPEAAVPWVWRGHADESAGIAWRSHLRALAIPDARLRRAAGRRSTTRRWRRSPDDAANACLHDRDVEIEKETQ